MKRLLRPLHRHPSTAGFTLVELLVAMAVTSIMIALAGYGLTTMLRANQQSGSEIARRANLNRAMDFMADEIRMARSVTVPAASEIPTQSCGTATGVMALDMPNAPRVIYYVHDISSCASSLWTRAATIRRVQGSADTLLVDALMAPSTLPSGCSTAPRSLQGTNGFYACLDSSNPQLATLHLYGRLTNATGAVIGTYPVSSQVSARSF